MASKTAEQIEAEIDAGIEEFTERLQAARAEVADLEDALPKLKAAKAAMAKASVGKRGSAR